METYECSFFNWQMLSLIYFSDITQLGNIHIHTHLWSFPPFSCFSIKLSLIVNLLFVFDVIVVLIFFLFQPPQNTLWFYFSRLIWLFCFHLEVFSKIFFNPFFIDKLWIYWEFSLVSFNTSALPNMKEY